MLRCSTRCKGVWLLSQSVLVQLLVLQVLEIMQNVLEEHSWDLWFLAWQACNCDVSWTDLNQFQLDPDWKQSCQMNHHHIFRSCSVSFACWPWLLFGSLAQSSLLPTAFLGDQHALQVLHILPAPFRRPMSSIWRNPHAVETETETGLGVDQTWYSHGSAQCMLLKVRWTYSVMRLCRTFDGQISRFWFNNHKC